MTDLPRNPHQTAAVNPGHLDGYCPRALLGCWSRQGSPGQRLLAPGPRGYCWSPLPQGFHKAGLLASLLAGQPVRALGEASPNQLSRLGAGAKLESVAPRGYRRPCMLPGCWSCKGSSAPGVEFRQKIRVILLSYPRPLGSDDSPRLPAPLLSFSSNETHKCAPRSCF